MIQQEARFIAGATCPACGQQDVIKAEPHSKWWCIHCGYSQSADDDSPTQTRDELQAPVKWKN